MGRSPQSVPRHVGIIMDGNGRWAAQHNLPRTDGHRAGAQSVRDIVRASRQWGIQALTLYAFSSQNWARPLDEIAALMALLREYLLSERTELMDNDIQLCAVGDVSRLPANVREPLEDLVAISANNQGMTLTLALSYGGRESIIAAVKEIARAIEAKKLRAVDLSMETFQQYLPTAKLPPLDLLIRTSGEQRVSNFLLWELAYTELYFTDILWPDFRRDQLRDALMAYSQRERRFGLSHPSKTTSTTDSAPPSNQHRR